MIPSVILVGLVAGSAVGARMTMLVVIGLAAVLGWGLLVASLGAFLGGTLLAIPNYAVGALVGLAARGAVVSASALGRSRHRG